MAAGETLKIAWQANDEVNGALIEHLDAAMLQARTPGGGMTVAEHLAHITGTVKHWGMELKPDRLAELPDLAERVGDQWIPETDTGRIGQVARETRTVALAEAVNAPAGERGELPHASPEMYLIHMLVHDAHHRGQILLALKTSGHALPDEESMWHPWRAG
ncbi:MAG: DinB family protein [Trueperaceae bacterium]